MEIVRLLRIVAVLSLFAAAPPALAGKVSGGVVPKQDVARIAQFLGDYEGQWDSEVTQNVYDDISRYTLESPVLRLALDGRNRLNVAFFMDTVAAANGEELDLLGFGCQSKAGRLLTLDFASAPAGRDEFRKQLDASFDFDWGRCPSRVHAVATNDLLLSLTQNTADHEYVATLRLLRNVASDNTVYAVSEGKRREVKIRPKQDGTGSLYHPELEYCVMNELGEIEACFAGKAELKRYLVPFPFPGMSALWYTKKTPTIEIVAGKKIEYHEAVFRRAMSPAAE
jgi:hypothetical protein